MAEAVKDSALTKSPEANRLLADALKTPLVPNYKSVVKDLKIPELPVREAVVPEKSLAQPAGQEYLAQMSPKLEAIRVAEKGELERQADMKLKEVEMEGDKYTQLADSAAQQKRDILADPTRADYKRALEDKAKPFVPNEENAQDMMALFGLLNIVGFAIGSGGKEYSQVAMSAMNGMLEGNRKGREDLYKKEKSIFETNQKQLDSRIKQLLAFMQDTELLSGMDKNARDQKIEGEFLKNKADTLKKFYETRGYGPTVEYLKSVSQAMDKAITLNQDESKRAAGEDFKIRTIKAEFEGNRQRDADAFANQISLKQQELQQKAAEAFENRDFELKRDLQSKSFNLQMALANYAHADFLAKLNRDSADAIELARKAEAAGDRATTAAYRARELEIGAERDKATESHRTKLLNLERQKVNADKQPSQFFTDPKTQQMYQWDANKKSWVVSPGLPMGVEKPGSGGGSGGGAQSIALRVMQQDVLNANYNLIDLKNLSERTGKLPGGSVAFAQKFTGDISTLISRYVANQNIDEGLQAADALMLNLAFDIASAQSGGRGQLSDAKVRAVVMQMPLDEQPEATKATKWAAILERVKNADKTLPSQLRVALPPEVESYYARGRPESGGAKKAMPSEAKMIEYAKDPYFKGDVQKAKAYLRTLGYE
jgi:hypothetical protein